MRLLTDRKEIAKEINIKRTPTVRIDLAEADDYGLRSQKVLIDNGTFRDGTPYLIHAEIRAYGDEGVFTFSSPGVWISDSFGYEDLEDMVEYANAPVIRKDSDVVIVVVDSEHRKMYAPCVLHTEGRISAHCSTPLTFTDEDNSALPYMAMADPELRAEWAGAFERRRDRDAK